MPINSAINPLLYTLTTKLFKEKVMPKLCCGFKIVRQEPILKETSSSSSSGSGRRNRGSVKSSLEKDLCEVGANTLRVSTRKHKGKFDSVIHLHICWLYLKNSCIFNWTKVLHDHWTYMIALREDCANKIYTSVSFTTFDIRYLWISKSSIL